jgi:peptidoglycan/LPS O-acetylase OafA/YrhL
LTLPARLHRDDLPAYLPWVDVLRFIACFLVIVLHSVPSAPVGLGHAGVALFFSISGFLIGRVLIENSNLSRFYSRRLLRIYPAYLAMLALFGIATFTPFLHDALLGKIFWHNIRYYITFTFQLSPDKANLPLLIVWSLCVEELFYLLLPLLFLLRKNSRVAIALLVVVAVLLVPRFYLLPDGSATWFLFPLNLFFGVLLALAKPNLQRHLPWIALIAVTVMIYNAYANWYHNFGPVSAVIATAAVWSLASCSSKLPIVLAPFRWMGRLSYGIYLLHLFCLPIALRALARIEGRTSVFRLLVVIVTTALAVGAAWLMQVGLEYPVLRLRPALKRHPRLQYLLTAFQVSLIPTGVLLAVLT